MKIWILEKSEGLGYRFYKAFKDLNTALAFVREIRGEVKKYEWLKDYEWYFPGKKDEHYFYLRLTEAEVE